MDTTIDHVAPPPSPPTRPSPPTLRAALAAEDGASTAEYASTVLAACGFAAMLVAILSSGQVRELLLGIITSALGMGS